MFPELTMPESMRPSPRERLVAGAFALATLFTATWAGMWMALPESAIAALEAGDRGPGGTFLEYWRHGLPFSLTLLGILAVHEMGHYLFARHHRIATSLPIFIPAPTLIGTFGAVIRMRGPLWNRRAIIEVGAAGPLAGFVLAVPLYALGIAWSEFRVAGELSGGLRLGESLLTWAMAWLVAGPTPEGMDLVLHPVAFAGWIGLLVTALNMLPMGQLDGGHIIFGLAPQHHATLARLTLAGLVVAGYLGWSGWLIWALLGVLLGAGRHPRPVEFEPRLDRRPLWMAWMALVILVLTFVPVPFDLIP